MIFLLLLADYTKERDQMEKRFFTQAIRASGKEIGSRSALVSDCFNQWMGDENKWISRLRHHKVTRKCGWLYSMTWKKHNKTARIPIA